MVYRPQKSEVLDQRYLVGLTIYVECERRFVKVKVKITLPVKKSSSLSLT